MGDLWTNINAKTSHILFVILPAVIDGMVYTDDYGGYYVSGFSFMKFYWFCAETDWFDGISRIFVASIFTPFFLIDRTSASNP